MALDTKYRPQAYGDVLGQEATVSVIKQFVSEGRGFHQSYVFCGQHGSGKCVVGDTLVPTDRGLAPIESLVGPNEIDPTDLEVVQEHGTARAAYTYNGGIRDTVRVRTHRGYEIEGTPNHRIRVMDASGRIVWRHLGDIREGEYACIVRRGLFGQGADLTGFNYAEDIPPGGFKSIPFKAPSTLTPEWGRLIGYLVGDGTCDSHSVCVSNSDEDTKRDVLSLLDGLCGCSQGTPDKRSGTGLESLRCSRKQPRAFLAFAGLGYWKSGDKEVPWSIMASPAPVVREFLRGYFEADGHVGPSCLEVTTKSKKLARQVHVLLLQFGVVGRLSPKVVRGHGTFYRIVVDASSYAAFEQNVGFTSSRKSRALSDLVQGAHARKARLTNRYEVIPHQQEWLQRFYDGLPRNLRSRETDQVFRARRGEGRITSDKVAKVAVSYAPYDPEGHFQSLHAAGYVYDPVVEVACGEAQVYDLNVPEGEMFSANGFMNHNTTLGRILARALLCDAPVDGAPCDACPSCKTFLAGEPHEAFEELDAATKSGKADLARIVEGVSYSTVSGKRRIYLFDEAHRLSKQALDALLKPMEDNVPGTDDKRLVCIFCTTEPEKMVSTIFSRCAPAFVIRQTPMEAIADRLAYVCDQEGIPYDRDALLLIAEQSESHIRDALKMVEGVSMLGSVTRSHAVSYLHLDANDTVLDLLEALPSDLSGAIQRADALGSRMSPSNAYERIAEAAMLLYRVSLGITEPPSKWDRDRVNTLSAHGLAWVPVAHRFAAPPHRPTRHTLLLDVSSAHHLFGAAGQIGQHGQPPVIMVSNQPAQGGGGEAGGSSKTGDGTTSPQQESDPKSDPAGTVPREAPDLATASTTPSGVWVDPRAIGGGPKDRAGIPYGATQSTTPAAFIPSDVVSSPDGLAPHVFRDLVRHYLGELKRGGRKGRDYMDGA